MRVIQSSIINSGAGNVSRTRKENVANASVGNGERRKLGVEYLNTKNGKKRNPEFDSYWFDKLPPAETIRITERGEENVYFDFMDHAGQFVSGGYCKCL